MRIGRDITVYFVARRRLSMQAFAVHRTRIVRQLCDIPGFYDAVRSGFYKPSDRLAGKFVCDVCDVCIDLRSFFVLVFARNAVTERRFSYDSTRDRQLR